LAKAQCFTIRLKLLKIGALIRITVRKGMGLAGRWVPYVALFRQVHEKAVRRAAKVLKKKDPEQLFSRLCQPLVGCAPK